MLLFARWQQPSALGMETTMNSDMSLYSVTELVPEEASATSGGCFWAVFGLVAAALTALTIVAGIATARVLNHK